MHWRLIQKRVVQILPMLLIIHLLTFSLFFVINSPNDIARNQLGKKYVTQTAIQHWKHSFGLDKPLFFNPQANGIQIFTQTIFFQQTKELLKGDFGTGFNGQNINDEIKSRIIPSLSIALPGLLFSTILNVLVAMFMVFFRNTHLNQIGLMITVALLSISTLFYIIFSQYIFAFLWKWFPLSGYLRGISSIYFILLPVIVHLFANLGSGARWCRTLMLEEIEQPYISFAKANGIKEHIILIKYVLRNILLTFSTAIIVQIPLLFLGSILYESFFSIPGLGNFLILALHQQDFIVVRAMVLIGAFAYMIGLILTDVFYILIDPRVRI